MMASRASLLIKTAAIRSGRLAQNNSCTFQSRVYSCFIQRTVVASHIRQRYHRSTLSSLVVKTFSTTPLDESHDAPPPRFAAVDHGKAYEAAMAGLHGKQLNLAKMEGYGKDDPPFDPFAWDDEIDSLLDQSIQETNDDDIEEAEFVEKEASKTRVLPEDLVGEEDDEAFEVSDQVDDVESSDAKTIMPSQYNTDGSLRRKPSQKAMLRAGYPSGGIFAIVALAGSQFKVTTDDVLIVNLLKPVSKFSVGSIHTLKDEDVLLLSSSHYTLVGMPYVQGAEVDVLVEEITKDAKVIVFKKRRKKHSKRKRGFRRDVTMLRILDIRPPESHADIHYEPRIEAESVDEAADTVAA